MIQYPDATPARILADVNAHDVGWVARAQAETERLIEAGAFRRPLPQDAPPGTKPSEPPSLWSDIKVVYMRLQRFKCVFCERALSHEDGKIEHDVEHYRPKNAVKAWRAPRGHFAIPHQGGGAADTGYYWLAYELGNYAAACKPCNSTLKASYFPIAGSRGASASDIDTLDDDEAPYLIFPMREDPSALITFKGPLAIPRSTGAHERLRASTTITLFKLNSRPDLIEDRSRLIRSLASQLELVANGRTQIIRTRALHAIADLTGIHAPHSACGKAFLELTRTDPVSANSIIEEAWAALTQEPSSDRVPPI